MLVLLPLLCAAQVAPPVVVPDAGGESEPPEDESSAAPAAMTGPPKGAKPAERDAWLTARVDAALAARPELATARVGVAIAEVGSGRELVARHGDDAFNVASNAKLVTAAAALARLGPEYRFRTGLYADERPSTQRAGAKAKPGTIAGDLVLRGGGDPTLDTAALDELCGELERRGVKTIEGSLVVDATFFDEVGLPPAYAQKLEDAAFRAPVSATALERDAVLLRVRPGEAAGAPALALAEPASDYLEIVNEATTVAEGRTALRVSARGLPEEDGKPPRTELRLRGTIRLDAEPWQAKKRIEHPERYAGETLRARLAAHGIRVTRKPLVFRPLSLTARLVGEHLSPPLSVIVRELGKHSDNFVAETLLKTLATAASPAPATWANGLAAAHAWLAAAGVAAGSYRLDNGSGLYDASRFSPRQLVSVLRAAARDFRIGPDYVAALSLAGADGTLARRMLGGAAERWVRAKTGTLKDVICISGYAAAAGRPELAFSVLINDVPPGAGKKARALGDEIATAIVLWSAAGGE
jgi:D-alanyl-D-alanine carboxypeptidase/D-alanyl-D-alanine-endopeptidase (penicillin-binding protein 4)